MGTDVVLAACPVPSESRMNNIWGEGHIVGTSSIDVDQGTMYGVDGFQVPIPDPASNTNLDTLWDEMVTKDTDIGSLTVLDLDTTGGSDASPVFEPGEPNPAAIMDMGVVDDEKHWYKRRKLLTFANTPVGFESGTPDTYRVRDVYKIRSKKNLLADTMEFSLLGFSVPALDDTVAVMETTGLIEEWMQRKYLEVILEQAWMDMAGLVESGAETPWEDAAILVEDFLEPTVFEGTAGAFAAPGFETWTACTFDLSVPGRREIKQISAA